MSKRRRTIPRNAEDRISELPEDVISRIMSRVPIKDAVRTSVLSKGWRYRWTFIQRIFIDDRVWYREHPCDYDGEEEIKVSYLKERKKGVMVVNFVERVIQLSDNIRGFCLLLSSYIGYGPDRVAAWIGTLMMGNVESLVVVREFGGEVVLPRGLLLNGSLRYLVLHLSSSIRVPARISYPNLKTLNLFQVKIINESSSDLTLALVFPVLETMKLFNCTISNVEMVEIQAPKLATFRRAFTRTEARKQKDYSIKIDSKKLVEFRFSCELVSRKFILIGHQVVYATMSYVWPGNTEEEVRKIRINAQSLLYNFSNLKELIMSGSLTKAIALSTAGVSSPVLRHLVRLAVCGDAFYAKGLLEFLHATPSLKFLKILNMSVFDNDNFDCNAVERVPPCIKDQLVEFEFGSSHESSLQYSFVKFLLKNGRALKKVQSVFPRLID